jgi:hypothetical protein
MTFALDADPTSATMNSYASLEFATDYFACSFKGTAWPTLAPELQAGALVQATNLLETFTYGGLKTSRTQPLLWPRQGLYDNEGNSIVHLTVPVKVQQATCELAFWIYSEGDRVLDDTTLQQLQNFDAGPVKFQMAKKPMIIPREVSLLLSSIGEGTLLNMGSDGTSAKTMSMAL